MDNKLVPALRARRHLLKLSQQGVGRRSVAAASDVACSVIAKIRSGQRSQIRHDTERRILAVTADAATGKALIDAGPTWKRIKHLLDEGFTPRTLARRLGYKSGHLQLGVKHITATNAAKVTRLYNILMTV